ncbi:tetratricopeptide repeat protein [Peloplasma aerotolerans]|uniref:Sel1 repeat family protein n=1 Tax=Peloplasma aerotolerans TaxID=3044389 RepID=A0AAW6U8T3_9MOLU|nr:hypothetical protein [Mariniplasma sp. M4Ah]MDI6452094.1 hypothetical protein [Mariniplasma sp. M4Ah]MDR4969321.1 hypothetical protein [Acholeplasmataceae bacterium]
MVDVNKIKAKAKNGDIESQFYLGKYYGDERFRDDKEAFYWLKLAADQGHQVSQMFVGYSYEIGEGVNQNTKLAIKYYKMAALQNFLSGFFEYGQARGKDFSTVSPDMFYKTTNADVANTAYQASMKYFNAAFLPASLPQGDFEYRRFKDLFDQAINDY